MQINQVLDKKRQFVINDTQQQKKQMQIHRKKKQ